MDSVGLSRTLSESQGRDSERGRVKERKEGRDKAGRV